LLVFVKKAQLIKRTLLQKYLSVTRQKFFRSPQVERVWSKRLDSSGAAGAAYRRLKANREENMT